MLPSEWLGALIDRDLFVNVDRGVVLSTASALVDQALPSPWSWGTSSRALASAVFAVVRIKIMCEQAIGTN